MTRKFSSALVQLAPTIDADTQAILDDAERTFDAHPPDDTIDYKQETQRWLKAKPKEVGGPIGPEPTRFGDWERRGRCFDF